MCEKVLAPSLRRRYSSPPKISEKASPLEVEIHQHYPNLRKGALIPCVIVYLLEIQELKLFFLK